MPSFNQLPIQFDAEAYDTDSMHDNVLNNERITFTTAGKYYVWLQFSFTTGAAAGSISMKVVKNGLSTQNEMLWPVLAGQGYIIPFFCEGQFSAGDYVQYDVLNITGDQVVVALCQGGARKVA